MISQGRRVAQDEAEEVAVASEFRTADWRGYRMDVSDPHRTLEPVERELELVGACLETLHQAGQRQGC